MEESIAVREGIKKVFSNHKNKRISTITNKHFNKSQSKKRKLNNLKSQNNKFNRNTTQQSSKNEPHSKHRGSKRGSSQKLARPAAAGNELPEHSLRAKALLCPDDEARHVSARDAPTALPLARRKALPHHVAAARAFRAPQRPPARDPRFDDLSGTLDITKFRTKYKFIEEIREQELRFYSKQLKKCSDPEEKKRIKEQVVKLKNAVKEKKLHDETRQVKKAEHAANIAALQQGRLPYYKKRSEVRVEGALRKFDKLKNTNKVDWFLKKQERKQTVKELKGK